MKEKFIEWLEQNKPKSVRHYSSGLNTIENILIEENLPSIFSWNELEFENEYNKLSSFESFQNLNISGNNILSATISNYKKFMEDYKNNALPPIKPFDNFKWRWAVTTPSEGINTPDIILGVLKILFKHNGKKHATQEFQDDLLQLQKTIDTNIDLAKIERGLNKNIIENSGQYWKALGLLENSTGGIISVSNLGKRIAEGNLTTNDFIIQLCDDFCLPNKLIESDATISEWETHGVVIHPIKLIFKILLALKRKTKSPSKWYLTPEELKDVVIPMSASKGRNIDVFAEQILLYRRDKLSFKDWPNCTPGDNDFRMVKEYLIFLNNFNFLDSVELKDKEKRYYLNNNSITLFESEEITTENHEIVDLAPLSNPNDILIQFKKSVDNCGLQFDPSLILRFIASLQTKPFVILTGLTGSGKTKLAQSFVQWICASNSQYRIVPVGADWTNREPLLGYPNGLINNEYVHPDSGALELILKSISDPNTPYFIILDEMNLSHVERYFADFLSVMESKDTLKLYSGIQRKVGEQNIPENIHWPKNLFIVGTVNIDESTYMFSPKVLDRANVIEFRVSHDDMDKYFNNQRTVKLEKLEKKGVSLAQGFLGLTQMKTPEGVMIDFKEELIKIFDELKVLGAEFGYRSASEIARLFFTLGILQNDISSQEKIDIAIMQKMLPKLHGSRSKLLPVLEKLGQLCLKDNYSWSSCIQNRNGSGVDREKIKYPISFEKILRMYWNAVDNGFASYAEA